MKGKYEKALMWNCQDGNPLDRLHKNHAIIAPISHHWNLGNFNHHVE
jgi:hypothetical protein